MSDFSQEEDKSYLQLEGYARHTNIWKALVGRERESGELTASDIRTLELRRTCLIIADRWFTLLEDTTLGDDPHRRAQLIAESNAEAERLRRSGITEGIHAGEPKESFNDPQRLAEFLGGQILTTLERVGGQFPSETDISPVVEETEEIRKPSPGGGAIAAVSREFVPDSHSSPLRRFAELRGVASATQRMLASHLGFTPRLQR